MRTIYQLNLFMDTLYYPSLEEAEDMKRVLNNGYIVELKIEDKDIAQYLLLNEGV